MANTAILGHSFVTRLERAKTGLLDDVLFFGKGGATSISLIHSDVFKKFMATDVSKVFLQVAGNDISAMSTLEGIVGNIDKLVRSILEKPDPPNNHYREYLLQIPSTRDDGHRL
ncbi:hypothetical protein KP79_PYT02268 [Mizuhopecten yessoensis]|uniref:SGNH hydrolase-type esterase domain-containing protein n=1 Tax=Mizuhopecten yessoensis TaxID=6573 RepID=A0A210PVD8_MIZYE|nr:hypothetical protein KP79_PYT02268 [Mizuhopecten yessoensis]